MYKYIYEYNEYIYETSGAVPFEITLLSLFLRFRPLN